MNFKTCIGLILVWLLIGCTSAKPLADQTFTQESLTEQLDTQWRISVLTTEGQEYERLKLDAIEEEYLLCHNKSYENLIIYYSSIQEIKKQGPNISNTIALVIGIPLLAIVPIAILW